MFCSSRVPFRQPAGKVIELQVHGELVNGCMGDAFSTPAVVVGSAGLAVWMEADDMKMIDANLPTTLM